MKKNFRKKTGIWCGDRINWSHTGGQAVVAEGGFVEVTLSELARQRMAGRHIKKGDQAMRTAHHPHGLGKQELRAMAEGHGPVAIDDMEFLETLARRRCMLMPPWVYHIRDDGKLEKLTPVRYRRDYNLDKPSMLLAVMDKLTLVH